MVCLIKPQFEAGREKVGKNGVVREPKVHEEVIRKVIDYTGCIGLTPLALEFSPIRGPEGNLEYLLYLEKSAEPPEEIRGLTEREAEGILRQVTEESAGLSREETWSRSIENIVKESHRI